MLQPPKYQRRAVWPAEIDQWQQQPRRPQAKSGYGPLVFGGALLVAAFAFAGHQIGRNAVAHNAGPDIEVPATSSIQQVVGKKGSLLTEEDSFALNSLRYLRRQTVVTDGKGDIDILDLGEAASPGPEVLEAKVRDEPSSPIPVLKPAKKVAALADAKKRLRIEPAAFDGKAIEKPKASDKLAVAAKPEDIEKSFKLDKSEKKKLLAKRRVRQAEENCLARGIYFEARSESYMGQMAVAKVILNRVKSPNYPNTICGVVYQGSHRRNSCQFSFACDGLPDDVKQPEAWMQAKRIAQEAIQGDSVMARKMANVMNYHADYVKPKWAKSMRRAVKIGRHIFYTGG